MSEVRDEVLEEIKNLPAYIAKAQERAVALQRPITGIYWPAHTEKDHKLCCGAVTVFPDGFARCYGIKLEAYPIGEQSERRMVGEICSWDPARTYGSAMAILATRAAKMAAEAGLTAYVLPKFPGGDPIFPPIVPYATKEAGGAVPRAVGGAFPRSYILHRKPRE